MSTRLARIAVAVLMLTVAVETAAPLQSTDPTAPVTAFDWSHRWDANGYKGR